MICASSSATRDSSSIQLVTLHGFDLPLVARHWARREAERAIELDPTHSEAHVALASAMRFYEHDFRGANTILLLEASADFVPAQYFLAISHERLGRFDLAARAFDTRAMRGDYPLVADRGMALQCLCEGSREAAIAIVRRMETAYTARSNDPLLIAEVFAALADSESAIPGVRRHPRPPALPGTRRPDRTPG